jgi:hypothetical protein
MTDGLNKRLGWTEEDSEYADRQRFALVNALNDTFCYVVGNRWTAETYDEGRERVRKLADDGDLVALKAWAIEVISRMEAKL